MTPWLVVVLFSRGLFGYDQGVISGALHGIKATFSLSALPVEVVTSWNTLGALLGALAAGELADRIGRKRTVLIAGAGIGVAAVAAPLYAADLSASLQEVT
jgi:MFS family permease